MEQKKPGIDSKGLSAYKFDGASFFEDMTDISTESDKVIYSMSHLHRGPFQGNAKKTILLSDLAMNINEHGTLGCVKAGKCFIYDVDPKDGYILHHRIGWKVSDQCEDKKCVTKDPIVLKYKTRLENNMRDALAEIVENEH